MIVLLMLGLITIEGQINDGTSRGAQSGIPRMAPPAVSLLRAHAQGL